MATADCASLSMSSRTTYSCIRCAERKVKCDRQRPCGPCVKYNVDCVFNLSQPPRKKHKRAKDQVLTDRLRYYEVLLQEQGIDPSKLPETHNFKPSLKSGHTVAVVPKEVQLQNPSNIESEPSHHINKTQVLHGQGRSQFVDNLWTRVVEEFHDPEDALEDSSNDSSDLEEPDDNFGFVLNIQPRTKSRSCHPPPERIRQLWQIFVENVDPLTKIVHVPTLQPTIQKAARNIGTIPRSLEALMFALYGAAVMSLKDDKCQQRLGEPRHALLSRYISATKVALSRAKFMETTSLVVLQALVLHLISVRYTYEPRAVWSLTGVAIRIAQGMGLQRDGISLGLPPFETEMRRRIWWLLKTHDFRTAELCGLAKFRDIDTGAESTKCPTNVNDDDLYQGMPSVPTESDTLTDVVFVAMIHEFSNFAVGRVVRFRQQGKSSSQFDLHASAGDRVEIEIAFRELEEILETKYLRYCDPSQPLHLLTLLAARAAMNVVRFMTLHPRRWASIEQTPLSERQRVWEISTKLLEQHSMMQSNPQLKQFAWHAAYFLQWHAFIHVLDTLRASPLIADAEKAWQLIANTYENNPDIVFDTKKPIHVAVGNLCLKAYNSREAALQNKNICPAPTPRFILQLRQRKVAKAKRQARDVKRSQREDSVSHGQANARDPSETMKSTHPQQRTISHAPSLPQTGARTEGNPSWYIDGFGDSQIGNSRDVMNLDTDFMLAQDLSMEDNTTPPITWEQWDAWLADSNGIHPLSSAEDMRADI